MRKSNTIRVGTVLALLIGFSIGYGWRLDDAAAWLHEYRRAAEPTAPSGR